VKDPKRAVDVLDADFAAVLECRVDAAAHDLLHRRRDADAAGPGKLLEPRGDVHPVAIDVAVLDDDVAQVDADAQDDRAARSLALGRRALNGVGAGDGIDHAAELDQRAVAHQLDHPAPVVGNGAVEAVCTMGVQIGECPGLVVGRHAGPPHHVGRHDRREATR
jgi:hypothetical protein